MGDMKRPKTGKKQGGARYQSGRKAKLRPQRAEEPPPLPALAREDDPQVFGREAEDGLRVLAALETISSLEPDFADDLIGDEASVTIIEEAAPDPGADLAETPPELPYESLQARLGGFATPFDLEAEEDAPGFMEEATVEIIGGRAPLRSASEPDFGPEPEAPAPPRSLPTARRRVRAPKRRS